MSEGDGEAAVDGGRLPDFLVIGAMKSATTSLFRWLAEHPGTAMPRAKEPGFFSYDQQWARGEAWYRSLMPDEPGRLTGEASPSYTAPDRSSVVAPRIEQVLPRARLVFIARDPAARARSHYLHQVRKARERRPFAEAVAEPGSVYVEQGCYRSCLDPYLSGPAAARLLVVRFEDLTGPDPDAWDRVLAHLGLEPRARPEGAANTGEAGVQYTSAMRALYDRGLVRRLVRAPAPVRRLGRRLLVRSSPTDPALVASVEAPIPEAVAERWRADATALAEVLGWAGDPWAPT